MRAARLEERDRSPSASDRRGKGGCVLHTADLRDRISLNGSERSRISRSSGAVSADHSVSTLCRSPGAHTGRRGSHLWKGRRNTSELGGATPGDERRRRCDEDRASERTPGPQPFRRRRRARGFPGGMPRRPAACGPCHRRVHEIYFVTRRRSGTHPGAPRTALAFKTRTCKASHTSVQCSDSEGR